MNNVEKNDLKALIELYCRDNCQKAAGLTSKKHDGLCSNCTELLKYAFDRLDNCPYKESKPPCSSCPIHCYNQKFRGEIQRVMRYSGPRIVFHKPSIAFRHFIKKLKKS